MVTIQSQNLFIIIIVNDNIHYTIYFCVISVCNTYFLVYVLNLKGVFDEICFG